MRLLDQVRLRVADAIGSAVLTVFIAALVGSLSTARIGTNNVFSGEVSAILLSMRLLPLALTVAGFALAMYRAGPFGFVGFLLEWAGGNSLFHRPDAAAFYTIVFGAVIVATGAMVWSWKPVLKFILESRSRQRRPPRPRP